MTLFFYLPMLNINEFTVKFAKSEKVYFCDLLIFKKISFI